MVLLVNVRIQKLCVKQAMAVVEADFLNYVIHEKLENENFKARNGFSIIRKVVFHDVFDKKEDKFRENVADQVNVDGNVEDNLQGILLYQH